MPWIHDDATYELNARGDDMLVTQSATDEEVAAVPFGADDLGSDDPAWKFMSRAVEATNAVAGIETGKLSPGLLKRLVSLVGEMDQHFAVTGAPEDDDLVERVSELARELGVASEPSSGMRFA